ncbi:D-ribose pyranase [uncultured Thiothrix sp.]|jgi:D-ribose pyranase|uniref:D-ribose pyranase n=1 Tax=uncultured Thiothrix sp. TaxID=223185 RepID=UPI0026146AB5|nr:D-ribose pyranase [uncultured Thiothrix sp.]HMT91540.1 D-ribose pyranase [Thiolinea sp.]
MKKNLLLHAELSHCLATLGHGDRLIIADAGLPIPPQVQRIDLAVSLGIPSLQAVLKAVLSEMQVERAIVAQEALVNDMLPDWYQIFIGHGLPKAVESVSHENFKKLSQQAKAIVRTGEATPYANIMLCSGVCF